MNTHHVEYFKGQIAEEPCGRSWTLCVCMYTEEELELRAEAGTMSATGRRPPAPAARKENVTDVALAVWASDEVTSPNNEMSRKGLDDHREGQEMAATKTATKPKAKAKAAAKEAPSTEPKLRADGQPDKRTDATARRGRGELEGLVKQVTDAFAEGKVELDDGKTLTPQRIANIIAEKPGQDKPSAGAVAAILGRWNDIGFALLHKKPTAFKDYSAKGRKEGLSALKEKAKAKKKADKS